MCGAQQRLAHANHLGIKKTREENKTIIEKQTQAKQDIKNGAIGVNKNDYKLFSQVNGFRVSVKSKGTKSTKHRTRSIVGIYLRAQFACRHNDERARPLANVVAVNQLIQARNERVINFQYKALLYDCIDTRHVDGELREQSIFNTKRYDTIA